MSVYKSSRRCREQSGVSLMEILAVVIMIAILSSVLVPVFATATGKDNQVTCASNLRQLGTAMAQYLHDYDGRYPVPDAPAGTPKPGGGTHAGTWGLDGWPVWTTWIMPYAKNNNLFVCPSDTYYTTAAVSGWGMKPCSYAYNICLCGGSTWNGGVNATVAMLKVPAQVILFNDVDDNPGWPGRSMANPDVEAFLNGAIEAGRHSGGDNFAFCDGHVKWYDLRSILPADHTSVATIGAPDYISLDPNYKGM